MEARSLTSDEFRDVISHFASGVTVITALHDGRAYGTTASAVTSLSLEPPMLLVCMNKQSETGRAVRCAARLLQGRVRAPRADPRAARAPAGPRFGGRATCRRRRARRRHRA